MSKVNIVLDATMLDTLMTCECKFNYRFNLNKTLPGKAPQLDRGTVLHTGFETYFNALKDKKEFVIRMGESSAAMQKASLSTDLDGEVIDRILAVFNESCVVMRDRDEQMEVIAVEQPFSYVLHEDDNIRLVMIGKIDLLVNEPGYVNLPYDHKSYERDFPLDRKAVQFCNYTYATKSNYLIVNRVGMQTTIIPSKKHKRVPLSYDPIFHEEWKQDVISWVYRYLDCVIEKRWPRNTTSCNKYNRICDYDHPDGGNLCSSSGFEAKMYKLESMYDTAEVWDVSKILGKKND